MNGIEGKLYCREGEPEYSAEELNKLKEFFQSNKNKWIDYSFTVESETRRDKANRHYWACLKTFCPAHYQRPIDAHIYFTNKYLQVNDVFEYSNNFQETLNSALNEIIPLASHTRETVKVSISKTNKTFGVQWVKSTTELNKKEFYDYVQQVILDGQTDFGLEFPEFK